MRPGRFRSCRRCVSPKLAVELPGNTHLLNAFRNEAFRSHGSLRRDCGALPSRFWPASLQHGRLIGHLAVVLECIGDYALVHSPIRHSLGIDPASPGQALSIDFIEAKSSSKADVSMRRLRGEDMGYLIDKTYGEVPINARQSIWLLKGSNCRRILALPAGRDDHRLVCECRS